MTELKPIRPASTLVLCRDGKRGLEIYMLRRSSRSSFMANVMVYPGGALEPGDRVLASTPEVGGKRLLWNDSELRALAIAGIREAYEEAGVLCADFRQAPSTEVLRDARSSLLDGSVGFEEVLRTLGALLRLDDVWYFARWVTPNWETKRFDARFFLVEAPRDQVASSDERETEVGAWLTPQGAIDAYERGELILSPPTWSTLMDLRGCRDVSAARVFAQRALPSPILPHMTEMYASKVVLLPGDEAYPEGLDPRVDTALRAAPSRTRIHIVDGRFRELG